MTTKPVIISSSGLKNIVSHHLNKYKEEDGDLQIANILQEKMTSKNKIINRQLALSSVGKFSPSSSF